VALLQWHGASMTCYLFAESAGGHPKPRPHYLDDTVKIDEAQLSLAERRAPLNRDCSGDQDKTTRSCSIPSREEKILYGFVTHRIEHLDAQADAVIVGKHVVTATADGQVVEAIWLAWYPRRIQAQQRCHKVQNSSVLP
jgi:hypothetical protein